MMSGRGFGTRNAPISVPRWLADGLRRHAAHAGLDILDIGCGTGLIGARVRELAGRLDGVDISPAMLEQAKAKGVYDRLFEADLVPFMVQHPASCDAVLAAAALIHFGDLKALFEAASRCLRDKGLFVLTLFRMRRTRYDQMSAVTPITPSPQTTGWPRAAVSGTASLTWSALQRKPDFAWWNWKRPFTNTIKMAIRFPAFWRSCGQV